MSGALRPGHEYLRLVGRGGLGKDSLTVRPALLVTSPTAVAAVTVSVFLSVLPRKSTEELLLGQPQVQSSLHKVRLQEWLEPKRTSKYVTGLVNT